MIFFVELCRVYRTIYITLTVHGEDIPALMGCSDIQAAKLIIKVADSSCTAQPSCVKGWDQAWHRSRRNVPCTPVTFR